MPIISCEGQCYDTSQCLHMVERRIHGPNGMSITCLLISYGWGTKTSVLLQPSILVRALCLLLCRLSYAVPHFSEGCRQPLLFSTLLSLCYSHDFTDASQLSPAVPSNAKAWSHPSSLWVTSGPTAPVPVPHLPDQNFTLISNLNLPS